MPGGNSDIKRIETIKITRPNKHIGLIIRKQYKEIPPRVEYSLTDLGKSLSPVFDEMSRWGKKNILAKQ